MCDPSIRKGETIFTPYLFYGETFFTSGVAILESREKGICVLRGSVGKGPEKQLFLAQNLDIRLK